MKEMMGMQGLDGSDIEFVTARKLKNGGILYQLNSTEAAEWLFRQDIQKAFLDKFEADAKVKDRVYNIFLEFVPVGLGNIPAEGLGLVESRNGLRPGKLVTA
ncbi:hypothetical protein C0993_011739, partial [Termitomyces sp. T159_Od127]